MKIAILGTRGIPNNYGGFEQFAEFLSQGLLKKGWDVTVYSPHDHPHQDEKYKGVNIIHCHDPEYKYGTAGQFIYDLNCIKDTRRRDFDLILELGYTSSSIWFWLHPSKALIATNMDGLEWKRSKYSRPVRTFLKFAESLGARWGGYLIADSLGIQEHLKNTYNKASVYIPYGADVFTNPDESVLSEYEVLKGNYNMLIARMEPENNIETILQAVCDSMDEFPLLVVGKHETAYGNYLKNKFKDPRIRFMGGIYNQNHLNNLRYFSNIYFHGHSVGGTNPSLLEAMASNSLIIANDNIFNKSILGDDAFYFNNSTDIVPLLSIRKSDQEGLKNNEIKIQQIYSWEKIIDQYHEFLSDLPLKSI